MDFRIGAGLALVLAAVVAAVLWWPRGGEPDEPAPALPVIEEPLAALAPELRAAFRDLALGDDPGARIHKWRQPLRVEVIGELGPGDREALAAAVAGLNAWLPDPGVRLVGEAGSVRLRFTHQPPHPRFPVELTVASDGTITSAEVALPLGGLPPRRRARIIFHGLARALGLHHPIRTPLDSIYYYGPGFTAWDYRPTDRQLIRTLYSPQIPAGTPAQAIDDAIARLDQPSD